MRYLTPIAVCVWLLASPGCGGDEEPADKGIATAEPVVAGKADFTDRVTMKGALTLTETDGSLASEHSATFSEDFEFHGFTLQTTAGSTLKLEVTQKGSSRGLDTALYIYGPRGDNGAYAGRQAFDDDSGYGKLSRLSAFEAVEAGQYLVVVGTYSGLGRGNYRLLVECTSGDCLDVEVPAGCPESVQTHITDCVDEWLSEGDYEDSRRDAFVACTTDYAGDFYEYSCESRFNAPEAWCPGGPDLFRTDILPGCVEKLDPQFPEDQDPISMRSRGLSADVEERLAFYESDCCAAHGESYTLVDDTDDFGWIVDSVRQGNERAPLWRNDGEVGVDRFDAHAESYDLGDDFVDLLEVDAGSNSFKLARLSANFYVAAGAEAWEDLYVFWFDNGVVTTIRFSAGET